MKKPEELRLQCKQEWLKYMSNEDTIEHILSVRQEMTDRGFNNFDLDELSRIQGELSVLKSRLGELVSEETAVANHAYIYRKWKSYTVFKNLRQAFNATVADSDAEGNLMAEEELKDQVLTQYKADMLKVLYESTSDITVAIQVRIKTLTNEKTEAKYTSRP